MNEAITHELLYEISEDVTATITELYSIRANLERETARINRVISNIKRTEAIARVLEKGGNGKAGQRCNNTTNTSKIQDGCTETGR